MNSQQRAPQNGDGQGYRIDTRRLSSITYRKENSVLTLQHLKGKHGIQSYIVKEPRGSSFKR